MTPTPEEIRAEHFPAKYKQGRLLQMADGDYCLFVPDYSFDPDDEYEHLDVYSPEAWQADEAADYYLAEHDGALRRLPSHGENGGRPRLSAPIPYTWLEPDPSEAGG